MRYSQAEEARLEALGLGRGISGRASWRTGELFKAIGAALVMYFLASVLIAGPFLVVFGRESGEFVLGTALANTIFEAGIVALAYLLARQTGGGWQQLGLGRPSIAYGRLLAVIAGSYMASFLTVVAYSVVASSLGLDELTPERQLPEDFFEHAWVLPVLGFALVVMAPLAEEVFFRGFLFAGLRRRFSFWPAALMSGALFAVAHGQPGLFIPLTGVGAIFAFTYERTGTLAAPIGAHFLFNLVSFLALVLFPGLR